MPDTPGEAGDTTDIDNALRERIASALYEKGLTLRPLTQPELSRFPSHDFIFGWRFSVQFSDAVRELDLLFYEDFPWSAPRVAWGSSPAHLTYPHIERQGLLCLLGENADIDPLSPEVLVLDIVSEACALIEHLVGEQTEKDFQNELLSYWDHASEYKGTPLISLINPQQPSRKICLWKGKDIYIVGENESQLKTWIEKRYGSKKTNFRTERAVFFNALHALVPRDYPVSSNDLVRIIKQDGPGNTDLLEEVLGTEDADLFCVLGFRTENGTALTVVHLVPQKASRFGARNNLTKGFRPGCVPSSIFQARYLGQATLVKATIKRADPAWIHGRDQDERAKQLLYKKVAIIGCGSIGAPIAVSLAQAGVGHILLVDPEQLEWSNIGRHPLGASHVGKNKAESLAKYIQSNLPHIEVKACPFKLSQVIQDQSIFETFDLIISATGKWATETHIDYWRRTKGTLMPLMFAWTEANACAGHAVLIAGGDNSFVCGFDGIGKPKLRVTEWPESSGTKQEPACGAIYQPYGPIELSYITSLNCELALDTLLSSLSESILRIWTSSTNRLESVGGKWSRPWLELIEKDPKNAQIWEFPWNKVCSLEPNR